MDKVVPVFLLILDLLLLRVVAMAVVKPGLEMVMERIPFLEAAAVVHLQAVAVMLQVLMFHFNV